MTQKYNATIVASLGDFSQNIGNLQDSFGFSCDFVVVVLVAPPFPRDGGTARTAIQVHAINLIEIRLGKNGSPF